MLLSSKLVPLVVFSLVISSSWLTPKSEGLIATSLANPPWPMFHQNPQHTGLSLFRGPTVPLLAWKFQTSGAVDSPPAVGRGRIYLTSEDGNVYALNLR